MQRIAVYVVSVFSIEAKRKHENDVAVVQVNILVIRNTYSFDQDECL